MSKNDITGDALRTRAATEAFREGHDRIFGGKAGAIEVENESLRKVDADQMIDKATTGQRGKER